MKFPNNVIQMPIIRKRKLLPGYAWNPLAEQENRNRDCICGSGAVAKKCCAQVEVISEEDAKVIKKALHHRDMLEAKRLDGMGMRRALKDMKASQEASNGQDQ